jgi:hypothetical protein
LEFESIPISIIGEKCDCMKKAVLSSKIGDILFKSKKQVN